MLAPLPSGPGHPVNDFGQLVVIIARGSHGDRPYHAIKLIPFRPRRHPQRFGGALIPLPVSKRHPFVIPFGMPFAVDTLQQVVRRGVPGRLGEIEPQVGEVAQRRCAQSIKFRPVRVDHFLDLSLCQP